MKYYSGGLLLKYPGRIGEVKHTLWGWRYAELLCRPPSLVLGAGLNRGHGQGLHVVYQVTIPCHANNMV